MLLDAVRRPRLPARKAPRVSAATAWVEPRPPLCTGSPPLLAVDRRSPACPAMSPLRRPARRRRCAACAAAAAAENRHGARSRRAATASRVRRTGAPRADQRPRLRRAATRGGACSRPSRVRGRAGDPRRAQENSGSCILEISGNHRERSRTPAPPPSLCVCVAAVDALRGGAETTRGVVRGTSTNPGRAPTRGLPPPPGLARRAAASTADSRAPCSSPSSSPV